jgi:hypothetical protein
LQELAVSLQEQATASNTLARIPSMEEAGVISSPPTDEERYGAEKEHNAGEGEPDTSSTRSAAQELEDVARPKGPVRPVTGIKVCSGLCLSQNRQRLGVR